MQLLSPLRMLELKISSGFQQCLQREQVAYGDWLSNLVQDWDKEPVVLLKHCILYRLAQVPNPTVGPRKRKITVCMR